MEKQWVEDVTKCPQYRYGVLHPYLQRYDFEGRTDIDNSEFYGSDSDDSIDDDKIDNTQEILIKFFNQVRESRGYDVDIMLPKRFGSPFVPVNLENLEWDLYNSMVMRALNCAMESINAESKNVTGKTYEFVEFKKIVEAGSFGYLFTFTARVPDPDGDVVRTLQAMVHSPPFKEPLFLEWRVKPVPDATEDADAAVGGRMRKELL